MGFFFGTRLLFLSSLSHLTLSFPSFFHYFPLYLIGLPSLSTLPSTLPFLTHFLTLLSHPLFYLHSVYLLSPYVLFYFLSLLYQPSSLSLSLFICLFVERVSFTPIALERLQYFRRQGMALYAIKSSSSSIIYNSLG